MKKLITSILIICMIILMFDGYVLAGKIKRKRRYYQTYEYTLSSTCTLNYNSKIYINNNTGGCSGRSKSIGFLVKDLFCSSGTTYGCAGMNVQVTITSLDPITCEETPWSFIGCHSMTHSLKCGQSDPVNYNFCFNTSPPLADGGYFIIYCDLYQTSDCSGTRISRTIACVKITYSVLWGYSYTIVDKPC